ncbi:MAG: hypothetical protein F7C35_04625 [Desulfurococcales archaeon]|nr:hypothetical protein [Desulfurococcales archaeon]
MTNCRKIIDKRIKVTWNRNGTTVHYTSPAILLHRDKIVNIKITPLEGRYDCFALHCIGEFNITIRLINKLYNTVSMEHDIKLEISSFGVSRREAQTQFSPDITGPYIVEVLTNVSKPDNAYAFVNMEISEC